MPEIAYLVHDIADAAVARRVRMFRVGGAEVRLAGFHRRTAPAKVADVAAIDLGRTADARLAGRALAVIRHLIRPALARSVVRGADAIVARNLETLAIAVRAAEPGQRIVFECLDIHRLLTSGGMAGAILRAIERRLLARTALVVTSSPAFAHDYFNVRGGYHLPIRIEENRVLDLGETGAGDGSQRPPAPSGGPPWRIGWFGMLRCRRSLALLRDLVRRSGGQIEVVLAGVPSLTEFDDFHRDVADVPGLRFIGPYGAADLLQLYRDVHFAWAIDYFEEGLNSTWLLPNRLYESLAHGAVPIALRSVETGQWLSRHGAGVLLDDPATELGDRIVSLDAAGHAMLLQDVGRIPRAALFMTADDCRALTRAVLGAGL